MTGSLIETKEGQIYASSFPRVEEGLSEVLKETGASSAEAIKELDQKMLAHLKMGSCEIKDITWEYKLGRYLFSA